MIMVFRISFAVFLMLCLSQISSFIQGELILPAPIIPNRAPVIFSGSHSGFGSTFQVLALVSIILNIARALPRTTLAPLAGCPSGYITYTGRCGPFCYRFETQNCTSFTNARQACARDGGDLLNVDACYYDFFKNIDEQTTGTCSTVTWVGASSATPEVNYITVRGDSVPENTVLWDINQPQVFEGGGCLAMNSITGSNHRLNDLECSNIYKYFCQIFI